jgi:uncharacterized protein YvpB
MTRSARLVWVAIFALLLAPALTAAPARAASGGDVWITVTNPRPGVGCSVTVSVEVRSGGDPVTGVDASIAFFDNSGGLISQDSSATDDSGVAWLSFDTAGLAAGNYDWLDINLGGGYVTGTTIVPTSDDCGDNPKELHATVDDVPASDSSSASDTSSGDSSTPDFPTHHQEHSLSCEYASIYIATAYFGSPISEDAAINDVPSAVDPHYGYRGDIDGPFGSTDDYGVYAEPLATLLQDYGYNGVVSYGADASTLEANLDAGEPTLVWIATRGDDGFYDENAYGDRFKLVPYEHVVVAYAYDDAGVWVSDPGNGLLEHLNWDWFLPAWDALDGMALSVSPA